MINTYKPEGMISQSPKNREYLYGGRQSLERAMLDGAILESTALLCDGDMNLHIDLHGITGIMPRNEVLYCREGEDIKDIARSSVSASISFAAKAILCLTVHSSFMVSPSVKGNFSIFAQLSSERSRAFK